MTTRKKVQLTHGVLVIVEKALRLKCPTVPERVTLIDAQWRVEQDKDLNRDDFLQLREMAKRYDAVISQFQESEEIVDCIDHTLRVGGRDEQ